MSTAQPAVIDTLRRRLVKRCGPGGITVLHRAFSVLDKDDSRSLDAVEMREAGRLIGLDLTSQEVQQIVAAADKDANGSISITEFLRLLRGTLPRVRLAVLEKAFKRLDVTGNGVVDLDDLRKVYDVDRHPDVLKNVKSKDQVLLEFLNTFRDASNGPAMQTLSYDDFLNYYSGVSAEYGDDAAFHTLVTRCWQLDQPAVGRSEELRPLIQEGFQSSAYWRNPAQSIDVRPTEPAVILANAQLPLDPFPLPKAGVVAPTALGTFEPAPKTHHKTLTRSATQVTVPAPDMHSTIGSVRTNPNSRGFLNAQSTTSRTSGTGAFDDDVMAAYEAGRAREREAEARRKELERKPFESAEPASFERSSQVHASLLPAVNRERPARPHNPVQSVGVEDTELRSVLEAQRATVRANLALGKWKGGVPLTTAQEHFSATRESQLNSSDSIGLNASKGRNGYCTEYSDNLVDRSAESQRVSKFDCKGTFKLINGVVQMHPASHHPRSTMPDAKLAPTTVVPNMFASTTHTLHRA